MSWADTALHWIARASIRVWSARGAKRVVDRTARILPRRDWATARDAARRLDGRGTCLSRALTVAARLPGAEVVLGVAPPRAPRWTAHAWVEHPRGTIGDPEGKREIARLR